MSYPKAPFPLSVRLFLLSGILSIGGFSILITQGRPIGQSRLEEIQRERSSPEESEGDDSGFTTQRLELFRRRHGDPDPQRQLEVSRREYRRSREEARLMSLHPDVGEPVWASLGPGNGAGRMTAIAAHPTIAGTLYAGADTGGVWKTTDGGTSWIPLTDSITNLEVGAVAVAPSSPNVVYLGSGAMPILSNFRGIGLLKSTDGGASWLFPTSVIAPRFFKMSVHPANPQELVVGTSKGGLRSTDGGQSWVETTPRRQDEFLLNVVDLVRDPSNAAILYATTYSYGVYLPRVLKSTDGGVSWVEKSTGLTADGHEIKIAISQSNPQVLYASIGRIEDYTRELRLCRRGG